MDKFENHFIISGTYGAYYDRDTLMPASKWMQEIFIRKDGCFVGLHRELVRNLEMHVSVGWIYDNTIEGIVIGTKKPIAKEGKFSYVLKEPLVNYDYSKKGLQRHNVDTLNGNYTNERLDTREASIDIHSPQPLDVKSRAVWDSIQGEMAKKPKINRIVKRTLKGYERIIKLDDNKQTRIGARLRKFIGINGRGK